MEPRKQHVRADRQRLMKGMEKGGFKAKETQEDKSPDLKEQFQGRSDLHCQAQQKPSNTRTEAQPSHMRLLTGASLRIWEGTEHGEE